MKINNILNLKMKLFLIMFFSVASVFSQEIFKKDNKLVSQGKAVMFIFESDECPYCELLRKDFQENKKMQELAKDFNIYLINKKDEKNYLVGETLKKETTTTLRMAFAVKATPNIIMFDKNWNKIFQLPGYAHPAQMIAFMNFIRGVQEKKYKVSEWKSYLKKEGVL